MKQLKILKELILIKLIDHKSVKSVVRTILTTVLKLIQRASNDRNSVIISFGLENPPIISVKGVGYRIFMLDIAKNDVLSSIKGFESDIECML